MGNSKKRRPQQEVDTRKLRKKTSILTYEGITYVDYKDVSLLRKFMSERAKIRQRRVTGNSQKQQREIARAIRIAREMALLPFTVRQVTSKSKKRRPNDEETTLEGYETEPKVEKKSKPAAEKKAEKAVVEANPEATPVEQNPEAVVVGEES